MTSRHIVRIDIRFVGWSNRFDTNRTDERRATRSGVLDSRQLSGRLIEDVLPRPTCDVTEMVP